MTLWNTPPEHLAGDSPLVRAATAFMKATQELDQATARNGFDCETAVYRRQDAYAAAAELAEAVRDAVRRAQRLEAAFNAADEALSEIALGDEPVSAVRADKAMTAVVAALAFGAGTEAAGA